MITLNLLITAVLCLISIPVYWETTIGYGTHIFLFIHMQRNNVDNTNTNLTSKISK